MKFCFQKTNRVYSFDIFCECQCLHFVQVLCSACYLQIPYVVDKCQEFIVTHGHVSSQTPGLPVTAEHRYLMYNQNKGSENSACELINTPPSPGNHSASNGAHGEEQHTASSPVANDEPHDLSPGGNINVKNDNAVRCKHFLLEI